MYVYPMCSCQMVPNQKNYMCWSRCVRLSVALKRLNQFFKIKNPVEMLKCDCGCSSAHKKTPNVTPNAYLHLSLRESKKGNHTTRLVPTKTYYHRKWAVGTTRRSHFLLLNVWKPKTGCEALFICNQRIFSEQILCPRTCYKP